MYTIWTYVEPDFKELNVVAYNKEWNRENTSGLELFKEAEREFPVSSK